MYRARYKNQTPLTAWKKSSLPICIRCYFNLDSENPQKALAHPIKMGKNCLSRGSNFIFSICTVFHVKLKWQTLIKRPGPYLLKVEISHKVFSFLTHLQKFDQITVSLHFNINNRKSWGKVICFICFEVEKINIPFEVSSPLLKKMSKFSRWIWKIITTYLSNEWNLFEKLS